VAEAIAIGRNQPLHKNSPVQFASLLPGGTEISFSAYKTIDLYATVTYRRRNESKSHRSLRARLYCRAESRESASRGARLCAPALAESRDYRILRESQRREV
jgi:hypothetical protein